MNHNLCREVMNKVNMYIEDNYFMVLFNSKYGGFNLSVKAIKMILEYFEHIPELFNRNIIYEYVEGFDYHFWNKKVRSNQEIIKFLLNYILNSNNFNDSLKELSGENCLLNVAFIPMYEGEHLPYKIREYDGKERIEICINKDRIISDLCRRISAMKAQMERGDCQECVHPDISVFTKICLEHGKFPMFLDEKVIYLSTIVKNVENEYLVQQEQPYLQGFFPRKEL